MNLHPDYSPFDDPRSSNEYGLLGWLEQTRVRLPLRCLDVRFDAMGPFAEVRLLQIFENEHDRSLDVTYQFPLPARASVYECRLLVDGRTVSARVEEDETARKLFSEAKEAGRTASLIEMLRGNLFQLSLGNVPARERVGVQFAYLVELEQLSETMGLRVPLCPGIRYVPGQPLLRSNRGFGVCDDTDQVPDASLLSPPRIDGSHPDAASIYFEGCLGLEDTPVSSLLSPTHGILALEQEDRIRVRLADAANQPDRDLILRWERRSLPAGSGHLRLGENGRGQFGFLRVQPPELAGSAPAPGRQLWFMLDHSGSMRGIKWLKVCEALRRCVASLGADDRVFLSLFNSGFCHFAEAPLAPEKLLGDPSFRNLRHLSPCGGTEILPCAKEVFRLIALHRDEDRAAHLIILTDGQFANEQAVLEAARTVGDLTIHTIGIDLTHNDEVLQQLALQSGGQWALVAPQEDLSEAVRRIEFGTRAPTVTGLALGSRLASPDLLATRLPGGLEATFILRGDFDRAESVLCGRRADGTLWQCSPEIQTVDPTPLERLWARREIDRLEKNGEHPAAIELARTFNLLTAGTSFIAIDEARQVPIATQSVVQPAMDLLEPMHVYEDIPYPLELIHESMICDTAPSRDKESLGRMMEASTRPRRGSLEISAPDDFLLLEWVANRLSGEQAELGDLWKTFWRALEKDGISGDAAESVMEWYIAFGAALRALPEWLGLGPSRPDPTPETRRARTRWCDDFRGTAASPSSVPEPLAFECAKLMAVMTRVGESSPAAKLVLEFRQCAIRAIEKRASQPASAG